MEVSMTHRGIEVIYTSMMAHTATYDPTGITFMAVIGLGIALILIRERRL